MPSTASPDSAVLALAPSEPDTAPGFLRQGVVLHALGTPLEALTPLLWATVLAPTRPDAWLMRSLSLSLVGRPEQSLHALLAARDSMRPNTVMWFDEQVDEALVPLAKLSRAAFLAGVRELIVPAEAALVQLVDEYRESRVPRVQTVVAAAQTALADVVLARDDPRAAIKHLDTLVTRYAGVEDARVRSCVASALLTRGSLRLQIGDANGAMVDWQRAVDTARDDLSAQLIAARALRNQALVHDSTGAPDQAVEVLQALADRFSHDPDPELRTRAAEALRSASAIYAKHGSPTAARASARAVIDRFRHDAHPALARLVTATGVDLLVARPAIPVPLGRTIRWISARAARIAHPDAVGIDFPWNHDDPTRKSIGWTVTFIGRLTQAVAALGAVTATVRVIGGTNRTSTTVLMCAGLLILGELLALLGQRLRGRFTVGVLRITPARLPRTTAAALIALVAAWLSPALERAGAQYAFGPPIATYEWLLSTGLPWWSGAGVMILLGPLEVLFLTGVFTAMVIAPLRLVVGRASPLVEALEDSFGSVEAQ
jgi:tetratricopeptide (TPR) repeat protein